MINACPMRLFLLPFFTFFICLPAADSQTDSVAIILGVIQDPAGEPLIGASVKATRDQVFVKGTLSDFDGKYRLQLDPGEYDLEFEYVGFVTVKITGVSLSVQQFKSLDVEITDSSIPQMHEFISSCGPPLIDFDPGNTGATFSGYQIRCTY